MPSNNLRFFVNVNWSLFLEPTYYEGKLYWQMTNFYLYPRKLDQLLQTSIAVIHKTRESVRSKAINCRQNIRFDLFVIFIICYNRDPDNKVLLYF